MKTSEVKRRTFKGGGCQFYFGESQGSIFRTSLSIVTPNGNEDEIPLKKMEAAHAAMGRAIEAWRERED